MSSTASRKASLPSACSSRTLEACLSIFRRPFRPSISAFETDLPIASAALSRRSLSPISFVKSILSACFRNSLKYASGKERILSVSGEISSFRWVSSSSTLLGGIVFSSLSPPSATIISIIRLRFGEMSLVLSDPLICSPPSTFQLFRYVQGWVQTPLLGGPFLLQP